MIFTCLHMVGKGMGSKLDDSFDGFCKFHISTPVSSHWSSEILKLDDKLTHSREHAHTTDKEQKQTIPSEADKATGQVRAGPLLLCYWGVSVFVHVCVCLCVCLCLVDYAYVYMPRQGEQMNKGTLLWIMGVCKGHPVPTLSPPTPSWLRVSVLKRGWDEEVRRVKLELASLSSPPVLLVLRQNTHRRWWYQSICCRKKEPYMSPLQRARWWGSERSSQARDHYPVGGGHVSVPWAGTRAAVGAGAAGINPSYGR